jgi:hypothetical protein
VDVGVADGPGAALAVGAVPTDVVVLPPQPATPSAALARLEITAMRRVPSLVVSLTGEPDDLVPE